MATSIVYTAFEYMAIAHMAIVYTAILYTAVVHPAAAPTAVVHMVECLLCSFAYYRFPEKWSRPRPA